MEIEGTKVRISYYEAEAACAASARTNDNERTEFFANLTKRFAANRSMDGNTYTYNEYEDLPATEIPCIEIASNRQLIEFIAEATLKSREADRVYDETISKNGSSILAGFVRREEDYRKQTRKNKKLNLRIIEGDQ